MPRAPVDQCDPVDGVDPVAGVAVDAVLAASADAADAGAASDGTAATADGAIAGGATRTSTVLRRFGLRSPSAGTLAGHAVRGCGADAACDRGDGHEDSWPASDVLQQRDGQSDAPRRSTRRAATAASCRASGTEAAAVRVMVTAIRAAKPTTVVTNYRRDGSDFLNVLTLHPVHDSENEYRYSIGILADGGITDKARARARPSRSCGSICRRGSRCSCSLASSRSS